MKSRRASAARWICLGCRALGHTWSDIAPSSRAEATSSNSGREWYEIWVPQDPAAWDQPKLVFRDISEEPMFWIDHDGAVVNGIVIG